MDESWAAFFDGVAGHYSTRILPAPGTIAGAARENEYAEIPVRFRRFRCFGFRVLFFWGGGFGPSARYMSGTVISHRCCLSGLALCASNASRQRQLHASPRALRY